MIEEFLNIRANGVIEKLIAVRTPETTGGDAPIARFAKQIGVNGK